MIFLIVLVEVMFEYVLKLFCLGVIVEKDSFGEFICLDCEFVVLMIYYCNNI